MKQNYKINEIDEMDLWYYLKLVRKNSEQEEQREREATIAQLDALGI